MEKSQQTKMPPSATGYEPPRIEKILTREELERELHFAGDQNPSLTISDRNAKENFAAVEGRDILKGVAALPIETWNYRSQGETVRHLGPMAQDFYAAFGIGEDDRHINTVDGIGIALAAIQGLSKQLAELREQNEGLRRELETLKVRRVG